MAAEIDQAFAKSLEWANKVIEDKEAGRVKRDNGLTFLLVILGIIVVLFIIWWLIAIWTRAKKTKKLGEESSEDSSDEDESSDESSSEDILDNMKQPQPPSIPLQPYPAPQVITPLTQNPVSNASTDGGRPPTAHPVGNSSAFPPVGNSSAFPPVGNSSAFPPQTTVVPQQPPPRRALKPVGPPVSGK